MPKKGLLTQTVQRFNQYYQGELLVGQCGDGVKTDGDVVVGTAQTLIGFQPQKRKRKTIPANPLLDDIVRNFEVLILDECHHGSSQSWYTISMASNAVRRYGLSGTPFRDSEIDDLKLQGVTGPVIFDLEPTVLIEKGLAAKPKIAMIMAQSASGPPLPKVWNDDYRREQRMPYQDAYYAGIVDNEHHNAAVVRAVEWLAEQGRSTLVLCRRKEHFTNLDAMLEASGLNYRSCWGNTETDSRLEAKNLLQSGGIDVLLATVIFDEGEDVKGIDALVLAEGVKATTNVLQRIGRGMRKKEGVDNDVWVVDFVPMCHRKLAEHALKRAKAYEQEGFDVLVQDWWPADDHYDCEGRELLPFLNWEAKLAAQ